MEEKIVKIYPVMNPCLYTHDEKNTIMPYSVQLIEPFTRGLTEHYCQKLLLHVHFPLKRHISSFQGMFKVYTKNVLLDMFITKVHEISEHEGNVIVTSFSRTEDEDDGLCISFHLQESKLSETTYAFYTQNDEMIVSLTFAIYGHHVSSLPPSIQKFLYVHDFIECTHF